MNVEQPWILNRPERVNAEATEFLPRRSKDVEQRVFNRPLITGARMKPGKEEHLHAVPASRSLRNLRNLLRSDSQPPLQKGDDLRSHRGCFHMAGGVAGEPPGIRCAGGRVDLPQRGVDPV